jgi:GAF domain-containing protein
VGLLGLIGTQDGIAWPVDRICQFGDRKEGQSMPIDPALLAKSIATLTDVDPERDLASTLEQAVVAAKQLFAVDAAGIMLADADGRLRWASASDPLAQSPEDNQEILAAGPCLQAFASGQPAVIHDITLEPR